MSCDALARLRWAGAWFFSTLVNNSVVCTHEACIFPSRLFPSADSIVRGRLARARELKAMSMPPWYKPSVHDAHLLLASSIYGEPAGRLGPSARQTQLRETEMINDGDTRNRSKPRLSRLRCTPSKPNPRSASRWPGRPELGRWQKSWWFLLTIRGRLSLSVPRCAREVFSPPVDCHGFFPVLSGHLSFGVLPSHARGINYAPPMSRRAPAPHRRFGVEACLPRTSHHYHVT